MGHDFRGNLGRFGRQKATTLWVRCQGTTAEAEEQVRALLPQKRFYGITKLVVIWLTLIV